MAIAPLAAHRALGDDEPFQRHGFGQLRLDHVHLSNVDVTMSVSCRPEASLPEMPAPRLISIIWRISDSQQKGLTFVDERAIMDL